MKYIITESQIEMIRRYDIIEMVVNANLEEIVKVYRPLILNGVKLSKDTMINIIVSNVFNVTQRRFGVVGEKENYKNTLRDFIITHFKDKLDDTYNKIIKK